MMPYQQIRLFIKLSRPWQVISGALLYALGGGIAHYLGKTIDWNLYWLGQGWITLVQLSLHYLLDYFAAPQNVERVYRSPFSDSSGALGPGALPREIALWAGLVCLAMTGPFTVLMIRNIHAALPIILILILIFFASLLYSIPPTRLVATVFGELTLSVLAANLLPTLSFLLQHNEIHRLLAMTTFPLTALHLAMLLALELPSYASDIKYNRKNLMVLLGWERGMQIHNILILFAFGLIGLSSLFGLPGRIALPALLAIPVGLAQLWMMRAISEGAKPNWKITSLLATAVFSVPAYLLLLAYWTN